MIGTNTGTLFERLPRPNGSPRPELLIVGTFAGGGIHHYIEEQAERLKAQHDLALYDMVAPSSDGNGLGWFMASFLDSLWAALKFPFRPRPEIAHIHTSHRYSFYRAAFYVLYSAYVWRRPVVLHIHGSSFDDFATTDDPGIRWLQSIVFAGADEIVVLSEYWRDILTNRVPPEKLTVLPNAVDPDNYDPEYETHPPHIVFVSNLYDRKGVLDLAEAIEDFGEQGPTFQLTIAGTGPLKEEVAAFASRNDHVEYVGYVTEAEKRELLESGSIFVLPTHAEGLPIAMLEGMAGGNAIITTKVGSIPEVITDENGILIDPGDTAQLQRAIESLVTDPTEIARMARNNRKLIEEKYSWDRTIEQLEELYVGVHR